MKHVCSLFGLLYRYGRKIGGKRLAEIPSDAEAMLGGFFLDFFGFLFLFMKHVYVFSSIVLHSLYFGLPKGSTILAS